MIEENSNNNNNVLVSVGPKQDYLTLLTKKRKTRWDDNYKPYVKNLSRRTRWGAEYEKTFTPVPFTQIPENLSIDDFEILIRKYRFDDLTRRLISNDYENADPDLRSPSPEPVYDSKTGLRLNTRDVRTKENYIKEKNSIIEELILLDETYIPPNDYKPPKKFKKLYIPDSDSANFVGIILGPNGDSQRQLEKKSGCKISIRGKGSNWNNFAKDKTYQDETEQLHVYIQADTEEQLRNGIRLIEPLLDPTTEEHLKHKMMQKQALAVKLGLVNEQGCENCGERGHRTWACPLNLGTFDKPQIHCEICKDKSHPTCDCPYKKGNVEADSNDIENEYSKFLKEINEMKQKTEVPVLEDEIKPMDIRNSVVWTGKIPEHLKEKEKEGEEQSNENKEEKEAPKLNTQDFSFNINEIDENTIQGQKNTNDTVITSTDTRTIYTTCPSTNNPMDNYVKVDYKVPLNPISDNKNVITSGPVLNTMNPSFMTPGLNGVINPQNNTYYNTYINPYAYNTPGFQYLNMMKPQPVNAQRTYMRNILPNNFQGKIPINQYGGYPPNLYPSYPTPGIPPMGRPNVNLYGSTGINQYGMPNINPSIHLIGIPSQPIKPVIPGNTLSSNNLIKPPSSDHINNDQAFHPPEPESEDYGKINDNESKKDEKIDDIRIE